MNNRRTPSTSEEGEVANETVPLKNEKVTIVDQQEVNEEVPPP